MSPLEALSDRVLYGMLSEAPDLAVTAGISEVAGRALPEAGLPDFSQEGAARRADLVEGWAAELRALPSYQDGPGEDLTRQVLGYVLEEGFYNRFNGRAGRDLAPGMASLTHLGGVHATAMSLFTRDHPLETRRDAEVYVERLAALPRALGDAAADLAARRRRGRFASPLVLERAAAEIRRAAGQGAAEHPFRTTLKAGLDRIGSDAGPALLAKADRLIEGEIRQGYGALCEELDLHLATAPADGGRPDPDLYAWRLRGHTTTNLTPREAHEMGRQELDRLDGEFDAVFKALGVQGDRNEALTALSALEPHGEGGDFRREIVETTHATVTEAKAVVRPLFNLWPRADAVVKAIPAEEEGSRYSTYIPPRLRDGAPGVFWINVAHTRAAPRWEAPVVCYHEVWPGHHLQLALAQELPLPAFRRAMLFAAYLEGWAKYSEGLPEQVGLANTPMAKAARLRTELYSTATLVMDTGLHGLGWSPDEARRMFSAATGAAEALADSVLMRSLADPGHLCAYKVGMVTMRNIKDRYAHARGAAFRVQDFHDAVLGQGALPLSLLEAVVEQAAARG